MAIALAWKIIYLERAHYPYIDVAHALEARQIAASELIAGETRQISAQ
jgi:hypothetical protein